jgi:hypothetical protein
MSDRNPGLRGVHVANFLRGVFSFLAVFAVLLLATDSEAHHRRTYYYHWSGFPTQITVYHCNLSSYTSYLTAAISNWNANGGFGTVFVYGGANCNPASGIVAEYDSSLGGMSGYLQVTTATLRTHEVLKDATQEGRAYYQTYNGQWKLTKAKLGVSASARSSTNVYAHELGHAIGLHEHYIDVLDTPTCTAFPSATIMDCPDSHTGPQPHDAAVGTGRYDAAPWGPGAIWISADTGTSITISWADINDNESGYRVMRTSAPGISGEVQQGPIQPPDTESFTQAVTAGTQYCYHLKVTHYLVADGYSSQICRNSQPSSPTSPSGVSVTSGGNNYTANVSWNTNTTNYTHEWVNVYDLDTGGTVVAQYYVRYHGSGAKTLPVTLGVLDRLPGNYYFEVYTCNAKYNPYNAFGCAYGGAGSRYLSN